VLLVISSARGQVGRAAFSRASGATTRISALNVGLRDINTGNTQLASRLDGNAFGAQILAAESHGAGSVGVTPLKIVLRLATPRFLSVQKLAVSTEQRNEKAYLNAHFALNANVDYLPTVLGASVAYGGIPTVIAMAMLCGLLLAFGDRWVTSGTSPARLILGLGLLRSVLLYEQGIEGFFVTFRGVAILIALLAGAHLLRNSLRSGLSRGDRRSVHSVQ
jgi:hypothetical protein